MLHCTRRLVGGGVFAAQILLLAVVPTADARLEADALEPHVQSSATASGIHDSHESHDHRLCDLCRALSVLGDPGGVPESIAAGPRGWVAPSPIPEEVEPASPRFLPVSPRAPPFA